MSFGLHPCDLNWGVGVGGGDQRMASGRSLWGGQRIEWRLTSLELGKTAGGCFREKKNKNKKHRPGQRRGPWAWRAVSALRVLWTGLLSCHSWYHHGAHTPWTSEGLQSQHGMAGPDHPLQISALLISSLTMRGVTSSSGVLVFSDVN